jgi:hypothetical protein
VEFQKSICELRRNKNENLSFKRLKTNRIFEGAYAKERARHIIMVKAHYLLSMSLFHIKVKDYKRLEREYADFLR